MSAELIDKLLYLFLIISVFYLLQFFCMYILTRPWFHTIFEMIINNYLFIRSEDYYGDVDLKALKKQGYWIH